jgi:NitT/TauT family transport system ATP-binding protein
MSAISLRDVWVEYGEQIVLERVNLQIAAGTFLSVVGPSGAGKSTFLRLILGQEGPSRGAILIDGKPLPDEPGLTAASCSSAIRCFRISRCSAMC